MSFKEDIKNYMDAGYSSLYITTHEETRISIEIFTSFKDTHSIYEWDSLIGLSQKLDVDKKKTIKDTADPINMFAQLDAIGRDSKENHIFILKDFHLQLDNPIKKINVIRAFKNVNASLKARGNIVLMVSPITKVPVELIKDIQLFDYALPTEAAISTSLNYIVESVNGDKKGKDRLVLEEKIKDTAVEAAKGMTDAEIENAFSLAIVRNKKFNAEFVKSVFREKVQQIKKSGLLTYMETDVGFENVGGLVGVKDWVTLRADAYGRRAREYGLPFPKGVGLAGIPGCGKTLISKAIANELGFPLFQLDLGKLFSKYVGETEQNFHEMIKTVESIGQCVIQVDEVEKYLNTGAVSGQGDSGTSSRSFGSILTWMSDRNSPAFIIFTSNNHLILPMELIRPGRVDLWFWVDLPDTEERKDIFNVVIRKYNRQPTNFDVDTLAAKSELFSGAEIDHAFKDALFRAFSTNEEIADKHLLSEIEKLIPQASINKDKIQEMRDRVQGNLRLATGASQDIVTATTRKIKT